MFRRYSLYYLYSGAGLAGPWPNDPPDAKPHPKKQRHMPSDHPSATPELSVVMPCFNEAPLIEETLRKWDGFLPEWIPSYEILVVNDGSKDGSGRILDRLRKEMPRLRIIHQLRGGHGPALRRGYESARGNYILQMGFNCSAGPDDVLRLWEGRRENHLVLGKRTQRLESALHLLGFSVFVRIIRFLFNSHLTDPGVPFRLFRRDAATPLLRAMPKGLNSVNLALSLWMEREYPAQVQELPAVLRAQRRRRSQRGLISQVWAGLHVLAELARLGNRASRGHHLKAAPLPTSL